MKLKLFSTLLWMITSLSAMENSTHPLHRIYNAIESLNQEEIHTILQENRSLFPSQQKDIEEMLQRKKEHTLESEENIPKKLFGIEKLIRTQAKFPGKLIAICTDSLIVVELENGSWPNL